MDFIIFLSTLDKEILELVRKANYIIEENKVECLLNKDIKGLHNFKENRIIICTENAKRKTNYRSIKNYSNEDNIKTKKAIRKALRHEAVHIAQKCNNNKSIRKVQDIEHKLHKSKRRALEFSISKFDGNYEKEIEAYIYEDKPRKVKKMLESYCL